jgi:hypothetical protein
MNAQPWHRTCKQGFRPGDEVWTPSHRKATLTRYRANYDRWDARYQDDGQPTLLDPRRCSPV